MCFFARARRRLWVIHIVSALSGAFPVGGYFGKPSIADSDWIDKEPPAEGQIVQVRAEDNRGYYIISFAVEFRDDHCANLTDFANSSMRIIPNLKERDSASLPESATI
jgi:hypothetical protein